MEQGSIQKPGQNKAQERRPGHEEEADVTILPQERIDKLQKGVDELIKARGEEDGFPP